MLKKFGLLLVGIVMSVAAFAEDEAPLCPGQDFVKSATMTQAMYAEQVQGYIAASDPLFNDDGIWLAVDGPFKVDNEEAAISEGQEFLKNTKRPFSKHAQTRPDVDAWFCIYYVGKGNQAILAVAPKFGLTFNPNSIASMIK